MTDWLLTELSGGACSLVVSFELLDGEPGPVLLFRKNYPGQN
jgi:hypothetical protein